MAPKQAPPKNDPKPQVGGVKRNPKRKGGKKARRKLDLKGWLKTPADWARFDAWAKVRSLPKKIPVEEPIPRPAKPLSQFKRRLKVLARPTIKYGSGKVCRRDPYAVKKAALRAKASENIKKMALPIIKKQDICKVPMVSKAALNYEASERILEISEPVIKISGNCKDAFAVSEAAKRYEASEFVIKMACPKIVEACPQAIDFDNGEWTENRIKKSALTAEMREWVDLLTIPKYGVLKGKEGEKPAEWRKRHETEWEGRAKQALQEYREKEEQREEQRQKQLEEENRRKRKEERERKRAEKAEKTQEGDENEAQSEDKSEGEESEQEPPPPKREKKKEEPPPPEVEEDEETKKRRRRRKNAWRFATSVCKEPFVVSESAQNATASARVQEMSAPKEYAKSICKDPWEIPKSALSGKVPPNVDAMAEPKDREYKKYAAKYEKIEYIQFPHNCKPMPKVKPFEAMTCEESKNKEEEKKLPKKRRPIDPIAFERSIDPMIDPVRAKRQLRARKEYRKRKAATGEKEKEKENDERESKTSQTTVSMNDEIPEVYEDANQDDQDE